MFWWWKEVRCRRCYQCCVMMSTGRVCNQFGNVTAIEQNGGQRARNKTEVKDGCRAERELWVSCTSKWKEILQGKELSLNISPPEIYVVLTSVYFQNIPLVVPNIWNHVWSHICLSGFSLKTKMVLKLIEAALRCGQSCVVWMKYLQFSNINGQREPLIEVAILQRISDLK